jgi:hypothetical protein
MMLRMWKRDDKVSTVTTGMVGRKKVTVAIQLTSIWDIWTLHGSVILVKIICQIWGLHVHDYEDFYLSAITHEITYGDGPFLRSFQLCSYLRTSQHSMEPEGSLPCSQGPSTGPYPQPHQSNPYHPILSL